MSLTGSRLLHGTLIIASKRAGDVVIVAESRGRSLNAKEGDPGEICDKHLVHPKLPLVVTLGGLISLAAKPTENRTDVCDDVVHAQDLVRAHLEGVRYERHLNMDKICEGLAARILPKMQNTLCYAENEQEVLRCQIDVVVGLFGKLGPELRKLEITHKARSYRQPGYWLDPPALEGYSAARKPIAAARTSASDPAERVAEIHADEIAMAIEAEAASDRPI
jgi:hypothetical protein